MIKFLKSSSFSRIGFEMMFSNLTATAGVVFADCESQVTLVVFLKSVFSRLSLASMDSTLPWAFLLTLVMFKLPQLIKVTFSPATNVSASAVSTQT